MPSFFPEAKDTAVVELTYEVVGKGSCPEGHC